MLAAKYPFSERRDILETLQFTVDNFIWPVQPKSAWERLLADDLV